MSKKRGLGRGLDALLGGSDAVALAEDPVTQSDINNSQTTPAPAAKPTQGLLKVPVEKISRGSYQPRRHFDETSLKELADSLSAQGMIQPVVLRPRGDGYELIAGERRWRAAQLAGLVEIPAIVKEYKDTDAAAVSLIENIQREDLNPLEEAAALQRLQAEFGMSHQAVAEAVGRSRAAVSNLLRLLELHDDVKELVDAGQLDMGHARALLSAPYENQIILAKEVISKGLSVRATEALVKKSKEAPKETSKASNIANKDPDIQALELQLGDTLGSKVQFKHKKNGSGKVEIAYSSLDQLEGILSHIK